MAHLIAFILFLSYVEFGCLIFT
uniref:Uncharacterized protein n=1 Tax=Arundo donax TaxID=35708 RepID=A0A0A9DYQ2_ARUDO